MADPVPETRRVGRAMSEHRILVVDDVTQNRTLLSDILTYEGYEVDTAASGPEALGLLGKKRIHLVRNDRVALL